MTSPRDRSHAEMLVLAALDREGGTVEHSDGRATGVLQQILEHPNYDTLLTLLGHMTRDGLITRNVVGKRTFAISMTAAGRGRLDAAPAKDRDRGIPAAQPTPIRPAVPEPVATSSTTTPPLIAGGKHAPSVDFAFEDPPNPPAKPRKLQLHEALAPMLADLRDTPNTWARLARFPGKSGATRSITKLLEHHPDLTFKGVVDGAASVLYGRYDNGEVADG